MAIRHPKTGDLNSSYKPVMLKGMLTLVDAKGKVVLAELTGYFRFYYQNQACQGFLSG